MYPPYTLARVMARNILGTGTPLGIPASKINRLGFKDGSEAMLYTGLMYQMMPFISKLTRIMRRFEGWSVERLISAISTVSSSFPTFYGFLRVEERDKRYFDGILQKISELLRISGVDFFYEPELDFYSGILLYEIGNDEVFAEYASFVAERLREQGIRKVITVDPHTTYALKVLYPQFTGINLDVRSYLELLRLGDSRDEEGWRAVVHDPCYYARHLEMSGIIRGVLQDCGVQCVDSRNSRKLTSCCGGPIESLSPRLSIEISRTRYAELKNTGSDVVTACPICLGNFRSIGEVKDVAEVLWARRMANG
jgi:Fe-S oxidoreductase